MHDPPLPLAERLKRESHRICALILYSDLEWGDIAIQIGRMRAVCEEEAPEKTALFDALYARRFERLWAQWRQPGEAAGPADDSARIIAGEWRDNTPDEA